MPIEAHDESLSEDFVTVDRRKVATLWRQWTEEEARLVERLSALVSELRTLLERTPVTQTRFALLDLFFSDDEQHALFTQWESDENRPETP